MIANTKVPETTEVTPCGYKYKPYIVPISLSGISGNAEYEDASPGDQVNAPQIQAIIKQAYYLLEQHVLGHVALACAPRWGVFLVFSKPDGDRCEEKDAKKIADDILTRAYWPCATGYGRFSRQEIDVIATRTVHLTKHHVKKFKWDQMRPSGKDASLQRAKMLSDAPPGEREDVDTLKEQLPMLCVLSDATVEDLRRRGRLPSLVEEYFNRDTKPTCQEGQEGQEGQNVRSVRHAHMTSRR